MATLSERLAAARRAHGTLASVSGLSLPLEERRDIGIMRLIYTFEATWKAAQRWLAEVEGIETNSPKSCVRASMEAGLLSERDAEAALVTADDRNLTVHIYNEVLANEIFARVPEHTAVIGVWLAAMEARAPRS